MRVSGTATGRKVEFFRHSLEEPDIARATDVLRSVFLSTGDAVREFEDRFAGYLGAREVVGVTSCTAAIHLSLLAHDIGPGDEVITTPMSFLATGNAVLHTGARPVFVDVEETTGNINAELIEGAITRKTRAILPVHLYGVLCDMRKVREIADRHGLIVIEDAAHSVESERDGYRSGQLGDAACYSFYATKNMTSGEGGAVATDDGDVAERLRRLRLHGMSSGAVDRYSHLYRHYDLEECGWKYNMDNIHAALLIGQIDRLEAQLARREAICGRYQQSFSEVDGIDWPKVPVSARSARHLFTIWVSPHGRDEILRGLQRRGVGVAINFPAMHLLKYYRQTFGYEKGSYTIAEDIGSRTISLPMYPKMSDDDVEYVIDVTRQVVGEHAE